MHPPPPNKILVCFFGPDDRVASYSTGFGFPIVRNSLISQVTPFIDEACETTLVRLEERKLLEGRLGRVLSHCLQPSRKFQVSGVWLEALGGRPPSNDANWRRQVSRG